MSVSNNHYAYANNGFTSAKTLYDENQAINKYLPKYLSKYKGVEAKNTPTYKSYLKKKEAKQLKKPNVGDIDMDSITAHSAMQSRVAQKATASRKEGKPHDPYKYAKKLESNITKGKKNELATGHTLKPKAKTTRQPSELSALRTYAKRAGIPNYEFMGKNQLRDAVFPPIQ